VSIGAAAVQRTAGRWVVHARAPGCYGEPADVLGAIEEWRAECRLDAPVRVAGRHAECPVVIVRSKADTD
jgi:hypothetical protein